MDERLAVVVTSVADLQTKLTDIISPPKSDRTDYYRGEVKAHKAAMAVLADEDMGGAILETWQQKGKYDKLLKLWVRGMPVDWDRLYRKVKPRRISLPTYPFTRERYWLPVKEQKGITEVIHPPLLHRNTSDFYEQRFTARFTGEEPFLSDHVVKGERMLSGSAYLEMVRAAVSQAVGGRLEEEGLCLRQISWLRPPSLSEKYR
ncbi:hypothetical protein [Gracilibacillus sp. JCM 18860]|uniref:hypothetical protein n=1 Tax=Gracilibacillus sp. JCM 18860 TaxID=1306159 RepID=UPI000AE92034